MKVSIICPVYNGAKYIKKLNDLLLSQNIKDIEKVDVLYVLTKCSDDSKKILQENKCNYIEIDKEDFSHSKTRAMAAKNVDGDIIVFISQDIEMVDENWLINLVTPIILNEVSASFSRQICLYNNIEKYTRENNYPDQSRIVSQSDIQRLGLMTFFYSDASSAVNKDIYYKLNMYDDKDLIINEDMYFAHKLITNGYRIKYCADSKIYHSHKFKLKELYQRYFDTGVFFAQNQILTKYGSNESGLKMIKYIWYKAFKDKNFKVLIESIPNFAARFIGKTLGENYTRLPKSLISWSSSAKGYWNRLSEGKY